MTRKIFEVNVQELLNSLPFYVIIVDGKHNILAANTAVKKQLSLCEKTIIGQYCPKIIHGEDKPVDICPLEESVETGQIVEKEYYDHTYNKWVSSAIYPIKQTGEETLYFHMVHDITARKDAEEKLNLSYLQLSNSMNSMIQAFTVAIEYRDPYTAGHQQRVSKLASNIAQELNIPDKEIEGIQIASLIHDLGKIGLPMEILCKPGKLNSYEYSIIKSHSEIGYDILKQVEFTWPIAEMVRQHHERINGTGYPDQLTDKQILIGAKIIGVADVYEAMISHRPYRQAHSQELAINELIKNKGILYDPYVVDACIKTITRNQSTTNERDE